MSDSNNTRRTLTPEERESKRLERIEREKERKKAASKRKRNINSQRKLNIADYIAAITGMDDMTLSDLKEVIEMPLQSAGRKSAKELLIESSSIILDERRRAAEEEQRAKEQAKRDREQKKHKRLESESDIVSQNVPDDDTIQDDTIQDDTIQNDEDAG